MPAEDNAMTNAADQSPAHPPRIALNTYGRIAPAVTAALMALGKAVDDSGLEKSLSELVKIRVSQINGCAYCVQVHIDLARRHGVSQQQLDQLAVWEGANVFSARERAALAWGEALALMAGKPVADAVYTQLQAEFSEPEIVFLTAAVSAISAWNRIAGALQFTPPQNSNQNQN